MVESPRETRRLVTVLFSDLVDSTVLGESLDPEAMRDLLDRYFEAMSTVLLRHGAALEKYIGDAIVAVFGLPVQREDDALRAIRAAWEMRDVLRQVGPELQETFGVTVRARVGVETGEVSGGAAAPGQRLVTGDAVNTAARLQGVAGPDEIVIGPRAESLLRDHVTATPMGPIALKGKSDLVRPWRVDGIADRRGDPRGGAFVGRAAELGQLVGAFRAVTTTATPRLLLLVGDAGMGKSRLVGQALQRIVPDATILRGHCVSYGAGITWWPIAEIVREAAGIGDHDPEPVVRERLSALVRHDRESDRLAGRLGSILGMDAAVGVIAEVSLALRVALEGLAVRRPVVVVLEDAHWAADAVLDAVEDVVQMARGPILLLVTARPELLEDHPGWPPQAARATSLVLGRLSDADARRVLEEALGGEVPDRLAARIDAAAEGNPLFLEQLAASLADEGHVAAVDGRWRSSGSHGEWRIPTTIRALLGARLERLGSDDRRIIEGASVAGHVFSESAARVLAPVPVRPIVPDRLAVLGRRDLVQPAPEGFMGDVAWRFGHALIRDAAYAATTKGDRAALHERFADWLVESLGFRLGEVEELVGLHLAEAWRYRRELRPGEDHAELGARAATHLARSGRRAFDRGDMPGAIELYRRASDLLPAGHPHRLALVPTLGKAYLESARNEELQGYLQTVTAEAHEVGDAAALAHAAVLDGFRSIWSGVNADPASAREAATAARPVFLETLDQRGLARVELLRAEVAWMQARMADACDHWHQAAVHARASGDPWEISEAVALTAGLDFGRGAGIDVALATTREILSQAAGDPMITVRCLRWIADLTAWRDGPEAGRVALGEAFVVAERLRMPIWRAELDTCAIQLELAAGDVAAAERILQAYLIDPDAEGSHWWRMVAATGAHVLAATGRTDEARSLLDRSRLLDGPDTYARVGLAPSIVAALGLMGDPSARIVAADLVAEADRLGTPAVDGETRLALARLCLSQGDTAEAARWAEESAHRFMAHGMRWCASQALCVRDEAVGAGERPVQPPAATIGRP